MTIPYECRADAAARGDVGGRYPGDQPGPAGSSGLLIGPGPASSVADVMVTQPKTAPATLSIAGAHALLADSHVHMLLLVEARRLVGTLVRGDLPPTAAATEVALPYAVMEGRLISPVADAELARLGMSRQAVRRLAVVDDGDRLLGLLCLKASHRDFCADSDVGARDEARASSADPEPRSKSLAGRSGGLRGRTSR